MVQGCLELGTTGKQKEELLLSSHDHTGSYAKHKPETALRSPFIPESKDPNPATVMRPVPASSPVN